MISHLLLRNAMIVATWTEDRAMLGSNPSAVPGAETEGPGHRPGVPADSRALRDQHQCDKPIVQPPKRLRIVQPAPSRSRRTSTQPLVGRRRASKAKASELREMCGQADTIA